MIIPISNNILDNFQLKNQKYLVNEQHYNDIAGIQEYRLYSYLTTHFNNITILDIGTLDGRSAVSLSHNESNKVISYDIGNCINNDNHIIYSKKNITFKIKNILDDLTEDFIKDVKIVLIDIDHYETVERQIIDRLKELNFSGLIILDDVFNHPDKEINECMKRLWDGLKEEELGKKYDFTCYGHWSGTGVIVMNDNINFIEI
jgi:predicted O-methyltransferase YrrM